MSEHASASQPGQPEEIVAALGEVKLASTVDVHLAPNNPRVITPRAIDMVARSLQEFGWQQPIVIDSDGFVVAGHTRLLAARKLKLRHVPVVVAENLTPAQIEAFRIADNRTHDFTTWDLPALVDQLDTLAVDFSEVLALADWEAIIEDFEQAPTVDDDAFALPPELRAAGQEAPGPLAVAPDHDSDDPDDPAGRATAAPTSPSASLTRLDNLPGHVENALTGAFYLTVCCRSKDAANAAAALIIDIDGVIDVRHKF